MSEMVLTYLCLFVCVYNMYRRIVMLGVWFECCVVLYIVLMLMFYDLLAQRQRVAPLMLRLWVRIPGSVWVKVMSGELVARCTSNP